MRKIGKQNIEKTIYARILLKKNYTYREIQDELKKKFDSGMSNTTLQKLQDEVNEVVNLKVEVQKLKQELALYKNLYFELLDMINKKQ